MKTYHTSLLSIMYQPLKAALENWREHRPLASVSGNQAADIPGDMASLGHHINRSNSGNGEDHPISSNRLKVEDSTEETIHAGSFLQ